MFKICIICKKQFHILPYRAKTANYCSRKCLAKGNKLFRSGMNHSCWKNGRHVSKTSGYVSIYSPNHPKARNNRIYEHRFIMEKHLGRFLQPQEVVHHIDGNRSNNNLDNLIILNKVSHAKLHHPKTRNWSLSSSACIICHKTDYAHNAHGYCKKCYSLHRKQFTSQHK